MNKGISFEDARTIVELGGLLMVVLPSIIMGTLALKWHYSKKGEKK